MTDGLELIDIRTRMFPKEPTFIGFPGFPPTEPGYETSKALVEQNAVPVPETFTESGTPGEGLQLVIGVRAPRAGIPRSRAVEVTYRVGKRRYREIYEHQIFLCAPGDTFPENGCPGDADEHFDEGVAELKR